MGKAGAGWEQLKSGLERKKGGERREADGVLAVVFGALLGAVECGWREEFGQSFEVFWGVV